MELRVVVCGLNGAGKSTLGRLLADRLGCPFLDIESYYFPDPSGEYRNPRSREEVCALLARDMRALPRFVLASVHAGYGEAVEKRLNCAVWLRVPREVRVDRVRERSFRRFGPRMEPGGDLCESEERFFRMVENRTEDLVRDWLAGCGLPVLEADGTLNPEKNADRIAAALRYPERILPLKGDSAGKF